MKYSDDELLKQVLAGDARAVARLITLTENKSDRARKILPNLFPKTGKAHVIGITGSPGSGKSTLVDKLAIFWSKLGRRVAVLAIDPTSPFSGGAVLGDRIRMSQAAENKVFIRSMATRGALGGVSRATMDSIQILDAAGFDLILVETVGVGQAEVDIVKTADTCIVVLVPGLGDGVQSIKAGILEIADLFVINKADRQGVDSLYKDMLTLLSLGDFGPKDWRPVILKTIATKGDGVDEVVEVSQEHKEWLGNSGKGGEKRFLIIKDQILKTAHDIIDDDVLAEKADLLDKLAKDCLDRKTDPFTIAKQLLDL